VAAFDWSGDAREQRMLADSVHELDEAFLCDGANQIVVHTQ
jgi:hypothetical protein